MARSNLLRRPQPMLGMILVGFGWALSHQWGSASVFDDCARAGGVTVIIVSLVGLVVVGFGGLYGYSAGRAHEGTGWRFLGMLSALLAVFAAFAVVLQIAAGLILPSCAA